jgi:hypothetical protein
MRIEELPLDLPSKKPLTKPPEGTSLFSLGWWKRLTTPNMTKDTEQLKLCISQTFGCCNKIFDINNLRKEGLISAHIFRSFSPQSLAPLFLGLWRGRISWQEPVVEQSSSLHSGQAAERQTGAWDKIQLPRTPSPMTYFLLQLYFIFWSFQNFPK